MNSFLLIHLFAILEEVLIKMDRKEQRKAERQEKEDVYYGY